MNHLENLIRQYYEWRGFIVKTNVKMGRLSHEPHDGHTPHPFCTGDAFKIPVSSCAELLGRQAEKQCTMARTFCAARKGFDFSAPARQV